jgi:hypothetical protein
LLLLGARATFFKAPEDLVRPRHISDVSASKTSTSGCFRLHSARASRSRHARGYMYRETSFWSPP